MTTETDYAQLENLVLENKARFTVEEAQARREAFNATVSEEDL